MTAIHPFKQLQTDYMIRTCYRLPVAVLLALVSACGPGELPKESAGYAVETLCLERSNLDYYFPVGSLFPLDPEFDIGLRRHVSNLLIAAKLDSLRCGPATRTAYRMISIGHPLDIVVEVRADGGQAEVSWSQFPYGMFEDSRATRGTVVHSVSALERLRDSFDQAEVWTTRSQSE